MSSFSQWAMPEFGHAGSALTRHANGFGGGELPEEAYARGYADGTQDGMQQANEANVEQIRTAREALLGAAATIQQSHVAFLGELEESLTVLALAIARQIVQREVAADPNVVPTLVRQAAETLPADAPLTVRLNPDDYEAQGWAGGIHEEPNTLREVRWVADTSIGRGGYVIETPQRLIDGQLDSSLRSFYEYLRDG